jgi:hypothetical protein
LTRERAEGSEIIIHAFIASSFFSTQIASAEILPGRAFVRVEMLMRELCSVFFLRAQECEFAVVINFSLYAVLKVYICSFKSRVAAAPRGLARVTKVDFSNNAKMLPFDVDKYFTWNLRCQVA